MRRFAVNDRPGNVAGFLLREGRIMVGYNVSPEEFERLNKEYEAAVAAGAESPESPAAVEPAPKKVAKKPVTTSDVANG